MHPTQAPPSQLEPKDQIITAEPDVAVQRLLPEDRFLVLACDGIWDVMNKWAQGEGSGALLG